MAHKSNHSTLLKSLINLVNINLLAVKDNFTFKVNRQVQNHCQKHTKLVSLTIFPAVEPNHLDSPISYFFQTLEAETSGFESGWFTK